MILIKKEVKILVPIILFLLILPLITAQNIELNSYDNLELNVNITAGINVEYLQSNYEIDFISANLSIFPRTNEWQDIIDKELISNPEVDVIDEGNSIYYRWEDPKKKKLDFGYKSKVRTKTNFNKIKDKIKFPIKVDYLEEFTMPTLIITSQDPLIAERAAELAEGEDDLYVVVHKIAAWTKENIDYSLETLTAEVSQPASWVFENKRGVCDELTALFVAMLRSLKIPARVVVGSSYTNVINDFGNHAWAEVYFPGYGWVAFDPTYGQLGYVDSTHVKLRDSLDIKGATIEYVWRALNIDVNTIGIDILVDTIEKGNLLRDDVDIEVELLKNNVKGGSFVPVKVNVRNLNDYYLPLTLYITKAPAGITNNFKHILLKPNEEKSVFFIIPVPTGLKEGYLYTSVVEFIDNFNNSNSEILSYSNKDTLYTLEEAQSRIHLLEKEEEKIYSSDISLDCNLDKEFYYEYENALLNCSIKNNGNTNLKDIEICVFSNCTNINLKIAEETLLDFNLPLEVGGKELIVRAENQDLVKSSFMDLMVLDLPSLTITNLDYSENVNYKDVYRLTFDLNTKSEANDIVIKVDNKEIFYIESLSGQDKSEIPFKGSFFYKDKGPKIKVEYKDKNNKLYSLEEPLSINVTNVPFYVKLGWFWLLIIALIGLALYWKFYKR